VLEAGVRAAGQASPRPAGVHEASTDPETLAAWWRRWPWANIGIATGARSGIIVVDVDRPAGEASLQILEAELGPLPLTLRAVTGGGGLHLLYSHPGGLRNRVGGLPGYSEALANVDLRADGGAIVAPPSSHVSGARYRWLDLSVPVTPAPSWLQEPPRPTVVIPPAAMGPGHDTGYGLAALKEELAQLLGAEGGDRNHRLNRAAFCLGTLVAGRELSESRVRAELAAAGEAIGLDAQEIERTIASGLREALRRPRVAPHRLRG
jgi:hypothetical protein